MEDNELGKLNIEAILKNIELAQEKSIPMCQDTDGLPIIFVRLGNVQVENLYEGIKKEAARAKIRFFLIKCLNFKKGII